MGKFVCRTITDSVLDRAACGRFAGAGPMNNVVRACLRPRAQLRVWVSVCALVLVGLRPYDPNRTTVLGMRRYMPVRDFTAARRSR